MAERFEITDAMRAAIGKETAPWTYEVTTTSVRGFARGVGYTDPVYFDVEAARRAGYRHLPAPPTYLGTPVFIPGQSSDTFSTERLLSTHSRARLSESRVRLLLHETTMPFCAA